MTLSAEQQAVETDKQLKKQLVAQVIASHCNDSSQFQDLRIIGQALKGGDELIVDILTGGYCNFSYRVFLKGNPDMQLYAKLSFPWPVHVPDANIDPERTVNEFKIMKTLNGIDPASVVAPYLCVDIEDMKLLVTQWSSADEQWANQFIDGTVDPRIVPKLASVLAKLHCVKFDPDFNLRSREDVLTYTTSRLTQSFGDLFDLEIRQNSRVSSYARELGKDTCEYLTAQFAENISKRDCLSHNDAHVFNILVEKKPDISALEQFGPFGKYAICDWEYCFPSSIGRDVGLTYAWPIACIVAHAINGNKDASEGILDILNLLWTEYASALQEFGQKDAERLCTIYRSVIGQLGGHMFFAYFSLGIAMDALPLEGNLVNIATARESLGNLGLKCMMLGFGKNNVDKSLQSLQSMFNALMKEEINYHLPSRPSRRNMRSSMLRASGRRVSDASVFSSFTLKEQV